MTNDKTTTIVQCRACKKTFPIEIPDDSLTTRPTCWEQPATCARCGHTGMVTVAMYAMELEP